MKHPLDAPTLIRLTALDAAHVELVALRANATLAATVRGMRGEFEIAEGGSRETQPLFQRLLAAIDACPDPETPQGQEPYPGAHLQPCRHASEFCTVCYPKE